VSPEHQAIIEGIRASAVAVQRAARAVGPGREGVAPREGEWSPRETLIHLRGAVMLAHGLRIRRLIYEEDPVFADFDEARSRRAALEAAEPFSELVEGIVAEHEQVARLLSTLPDADWGRQGRHPTLGVMSIELLARRAAEHAQEHAAQVASAARADGPAR
jgi:DinB superfamily